MSKIRLLSPIFFVLWFILLVGSGFGLSQSKTDQQKSWDILAQQAQTAIELNTVSDDVLDSYRNRLIEVRVKALEIEKKYGVLVVDIKKQLEDLGVPSDETESEPQEILQKRAELNSDLIQNKTPLLLSRANRERADQLIERIDVLLRSRLEKKLTAHGPSPVNYMNWLLALSEISKFSNALASEVASGLQVSNDESRFLENLPITFFWFGLSLTVLIWLPKLILTKINNQPLGEIVSPLSRLLLATKNLIQLFIPWLGVSLMAMALKASDLFGKYTSLFFDQALYIIFSMVVGRWIGVSLFSKKVEIGQIFNLGGKKEILTVTACTILGVISAVNILFNSLVEEVQFSSETVAIINFPLIIVGGFYLFRIMTTIRFSLSQTVSKIENSKTILILVNIGVFISIISPLSAGLGYSEAGQFLFFGVIKTFAILSITFIIFSVLEIMIEGFILVRSPKNDNEVPSSKRSLIVTLVGFFLLLLNVPIIALIWGARNSDLAEIWFVLNEGIPLGSGQISFSSLTSLVVIFVLGYLATKSLQNFLREKVLPNTSLDIGGKTAVLSGVGYLGYILAAFLAISSAGLNLSSLAIVAGALSVGLGFGMQTIVSNFVSGLIMLVERPIQEGDWIEVGGHSGTVKQISVRATHLETFNKQTAIIPNSAIITGSVLNWTHDAHHGRVTVPIDVAYGTDPRLVEALLLSIASENINVLIDPKPIVIFKSFGESALNFELRAFINEKFSLSVKSEINFEISRVFEENNVSIPFPQRDINVRYLK